MKRFRHGDLLFARGGWVRTLGWSPFVPGWAIVWVKKQEEVHARFANTPSLLDAVRRCLWVEVVQADGEGRAIKETEGAHKSLNPSELERWRKLNTEETLRLMRHLHETHP